MTADAGTSDSDCKQSQSEAQHAALCRVMDRNGGERVTADWEAIKADYLTGELSVKELAAKHGINTNQIYKKVSSEGWKKTLEKIRQKTEENVVARAARARARELDVIASSTEKMAALLAKTVEELDAQPTDKRLRNLKGLAATASAIETNLQTTLKLLGIQTRAQEEAQRIARARLELDRRKQRFAENQASTAQEAAELHVTVTMEEPDGQEKQDNQRED